MCLLISGCATVSTQKFIDVDETVDIKPGISKDDALELLGPPKEVRAGIVKKDGSIVEKWLYDHKTQMFEVNAKQVNKMKVAINQRPYEWVNTQTFEFIFVNDKLVKWGHDGDDWADIEDVKGGGEVNGPADGSDNSGGGLFGGSGGNSGSGGGMLSKIPIIGKLFGGGK
jgi:uncharacterized membrane protein YgcG